MQLGNGWEVTHDLSISHNQMESKYGEKGLFYIFIEEKEMLVSRIINEKQMLDTGKVNMVRGACSIYS